MDFCLWLSLTDKSNHRITCLSLQSLSPGVPFHHSVVSENHRNCHSQEHYPNLGLPVESTSVFHKTPWSGKTVSQGKSGQPHQRPCGWTIGKTAASGTGSASCDPTKQTQQKKSNWTLLHSWAHSKSVDMQTYLEIEDISIWGLL